MRIAVFSAKPYDRQFLDAANAGAQHELVYFVPRLTGDTAVLAAGAPCVCAFVQDELDRRTLEALAAGGTRLVALRCAGFNNVDLAAGRAPGIKVAPGPAQSS